MEEKTPFSKRSYVRGDKCASFETLRAQAPALDIIITLHPIYTVCTYRIEVAEYEVMMYCAVTALPDMQLDQVFVCSSMVTDYVG